MNDSFQHITQSNDTLDPALLPEPDPLMSQAGLRPPLDFEKKVMARIADVIERDRVHGADTVRDRAGGAPSVSRWLAPLRWLALVSGGAFAFSEVLTFMLGLWAVSTAL
jgi:hypothetical protein